MNENRLPTHRPTRVDDLLPRSAYDGLGELDRLRLKLREAQAKANQLDRLNAAAWQREQDRRAREQEAAAERRRKGR